MRYHRANTPGATYFFTLNAANRKGQVLLDHVDHLRQSFRQVRARHPFVLEAVVVLPEHLHMLMTLPPEDADFATRIMLIKQGFTRRVPEGERKPFGAGRTRAVAAPLLGTPDP